MKIGDVITLSETEQEVMKDYDNRLKNAEVRMRTAGEDIVRERDEVFGFIAATHPELEGWVFKFLNDHKGLVIVKEAKE